MASSIRDALLSTDDGVILVQVSSRVRQERLEQMEGAVVGIAKRITRNAKRREQRRELRREQRLVQIESVLPGIIENVERYTAERETERKALAERIRTLKNTAHDVLVSERLRSSRQVRFDVYNRSKELLREIASEGGTEYTRMLSLLKYASVSRNAWDELLDALPTDDEEHDFSAYESSDCLSRHVA